jgi:LysR family transcriptional regulator, regulator of abg operon
LITSPYQSDRFFRVTLQQLRDFLAVTEHGSFRSAARVLGVSQAGLTNSLKSLESSVGAVLLARSGRGVNLTPAGEMLRVRASLIDAEAQRAAAELGAVAEQYHGPVRLGFSPTPSALLLPAVVPLFRARYPGAELRLVGGLFERLLPAVREGQLDFAVISLPEVGVGHGIHAHTLMKADLAVVGRLGHPLAGARRLGDLAEQEWILMGPPGAPGGTVVRMFAEAGLASPRIALVCDSLTQVGALLLDSDYLALLPRMMLERGLLRRNVAEIRVQESARPQDVALVRRSEVPLTPMANALAAMLTSCARSLGQVTQ